MKDDCGDGSDEQNCGKMEYNTLALFNTRIKTNGKVKILFSFFLISIAGKINVGKPCGIECTAQGPCEFCGTGYCCQKGFNDKSNGCNGLIGGSNAHTCVPAPGITVSNSAFLIRIMDKNY